MRARFLSLALCALTLAGLLALAPGRAAPGPSDKGADDAGRPQDLILILDVSDSMLFGTEVTGKDGKVSHEPASDPEGMRWDGVQFVLDIARPEDRVALVVFSGDAHVLTKAVADNRSGFVQMDLKGRATLKKVVADIQDAERAIVKAGTKEGVEPYKVGKEAFKPWPNTSVVCALRTAAGLLKKDKERDTRVLLLTDGEEILPFEDAPGTSWPRAADDNPFKTKKAYTDYFNELQNSKGSAEKLDKLAESYVMPYREANAPIDTFALGSLCDHELLESISRVSRPPGAVDKVGAAYRTGTNVKLLEQLRVVGWELRHTWQLPVEVKQGDKQEKFYTPAVKPWRDLGVLLYCVPREGAARARAPDDPAVKAEVDGPRAGDRSFKDVPRLSSHSHWYYPLGGEVAEKYAFPADQQLEWVVRHEGKQSYRSEAVVAFRTRRELFAYRQPEGGERFGPLDAIPFRVDFLIPEGGGENPFRAEDFEIEARLTPVGGDGAKDLPDGGVVRLVRSEAEGSVVPFRANVPLYPDPKTKDWSGFFGRYNVDVIVSSTGGLLPAKTTRQFERRTIAIEKRYPPLSVSPKIVVLTNKRPESVRGTFAVSVNVKGSAGRDVATLSASLTNRPTAPSGKAVGGEFQISPKKIGLTAGRAEVTVELPAAAWSGLAPGKYTAGSVEVKAPWQGDKGEIVELQVVKEEYGLDVGRDPVKFDVSNRKQRAGAAKVAVALKTALDTEEEVWLSTSDKRRDKPGEKEGRLTVKADGETTPFEVEVEGLGKPKPLHGGDRPPATELATLSAKCPPGLPFGKKFTGELFVVGPAVRWEKIKVEVSRERLALGDVGKEMLFDLSAKEPKPRPVSTAVRLWLAEAPDVPEAVHLSLSPDDKAPPADARLEVHEKSAPAGQKPRTVELPISGLGKAVALSAGSDRTETIRVELTRTPDLKPGLYEGELWAGGEGVTYRKIRVLVNVEQPVAYLGSGQDAVLLPGDWRLAALANTTVRRTIFFKSSVGRQDVIRGLVAKLKDQPLAMARTIPREGGGDHLLIDVRPKDDRLEIELAVPRSVREGSYSLPRPLELDLRESPSAPPLLVSLPLTVQVAQAALPDVKGPLLLKPDKPCGTDFAGSFRLAAPVDAPIPLAAPVDAPIRGWVEIDREFNKSLQGPGGAIRALPEEALEVFCGKDAGRRRVLPGNGGYDPLGRDRPCEIGVVAHRGSLPPGAYRTRLLFHSYVDDEKQKATAGLDVEMLVPGRRLEAEVVGGNAPQVGQEVEVRVVVSCVGCDAGAGTLRPLGGGAPLRLADGKRLHPDGDGAVPAVYEYRARVVPARAGKNVFEVNWPRCCPAGAGETAEHVKEVSIDARGTIEALPAQAAGGPSPVLFVHPGEVFRLRVAVAPSSKKLLADQPLRLRASRPALNNDKSLDLVLYDDGSREHGDETANDGVYCGRVSLPELGRYRIELASQVPGLELAAADVLAAFTFEQPMKDKGEVLYYGGGGVLSWWPNHEAISLKNVAVLENQAVPEDRGALRCRWHATLLYPRTLDAAGREASAVDPSNPDAVTSQPDKAMHLDAELTCPAPDDRWARASDGSLSGEMRNGDQLQLGVDSKFSTEALKQLYDNDDSHRTLRDKDWMFARVELRWEDADGHEVARRTVYAPLTVRPRSLGWASWVMSYVVLPLLLFGVLGTGGVWYLRRRRRLREVQAGKPNRAAGPLAVPPPSDGETARTAPPAAPAPEAAPPRKPPENRPPRRPPGM